jgi:molybdate transport system substrate-binding protein
VKPSPLIAIVALGSLAACASSPEGPPPLQVFCGSANKPAMRRIATDYQASTGVPVELIYGGSGTLLSQMQLSRRGDIYLPGSPDYIEIALAKEQIIPGSDRVVAYLVPSLIVPEGNPAGVSGLEDLARPGLKVGIGNPETVCLGLYGVEILEHNGLLDAVLPNVVTFGASCSKTADLAAIGSVDVILGWRVFDAWNPARMDAVALRPGQIPRVSTIPISIPVYAEDPARSQAFIDFVLSPAGQRAYAQAGYLTDRDEALSLAPGASIGGRYELPADYTQRLAATVGR